MEKIKISSCKFFPILGHQTRSGSGIRIRNLKNAGSGSALNQCGSATLLKVMTIITPMSGIVDHYRFNADPDPQPNFHLDEEPNPDPQHYQRER
jgi:hypothetical protein